MSADSNTHPHDDLAVYALDALDPDERVVIETHLAGCQPCRAELDRHRDTLAQLTRDEPPPAHVWDRIAGAIGAEATLAPAPFVEPAELAEPPETGAPVVALHLRTRRSRAERRRPWLAASAAVAAAAVAVVGLAVFVGGDDADPGSVADLAQAAAEDADSTVVPLSDDAGALQARVVLAADGTGYVLLDELPTLPAGRSYQLWATDDPAGPVSLGVLGDGSAEARAVALPAGSSDFAVSDEPSRGVVAPTGPIVAQGSATA